MWTRPRAVLAALTAAAIALSIVAFEFYPIVHPAPSAAERAVNVSAPMPNIKGAPVVAFIGDSYTAGAGVNQAVDRWVNIVSVHESWLPVNLGSGGTGYLTTNGKKGCGADFCPTYQQVIFAAQKVHPDLVVVSGGRNDLGKPGVAVKAGIDRFYTDLRAALPYTPILVTSPIFDDNQPPPEMVPLRADVRIAAQRVGATYIDIGEPLEGQPSAVVSDGIHPNQKGHLLIAAAVEAKIDALHLTL